MEDFSFRPSYEVEKVPSAFLSSALTYLDSLDHTKASLKAENIPNALQVNQEYRRHRLNSYENPMFFPFKDDDHFPNMADPVKAEAFVQDFANFGHLPPAEFGFDFPISKGLQDYAVDYYRINRSRGPSFHIGPGRKASEDIFAHGFDLLNLCNRNFEQHNQEQQDNKAHATFLDAPLAHQGLAGNFHSTAENNYHNNLQMHLENVLPKDFMMGSIANAIQQQSQALHQATESKSSAQNQQEEAHQSEMEPKTQKKRKANNNKEIATKQEDDVPSTPLKKSKSENKKGSKTELKSAKIMDEKPAAKKSKSKKGLVSQGLEDHGVKEEKSTEASTNVSPVPKKEDLPALFKSKSSLVGTFGHFKQPETAQELLGGLSLPAEVEEYINNSKIFNQIKAPIMKKIGTLTLEERRVKIEKYLEKRKRRSWNKRVNYDCRKKVADNRLRIKGRFVTKDQAFSMLEAIGIYPDPEKITNNEIKEILTSRFGGILKKKDFGGDILGGDNQGGSNQFKIPGNTQEFNFGEADSFGSQDDGLSENYLRD